MIIQEFAKVLHQYPSSIPPIAILNRWLKDILLKEANDPVEKMIHAELTLLQDNKGTYAVVGTKKSGQRLMKNLYEYIQSYEAFNFGRWVHNIKPVDFTKIN